MASDPELPLFDVQAILGHVSLTTTQLYLTPSEDEVIEHALAHYARRANTRAAAVPATPAPGYNPAALDVLFGRP
ncbi:hypothetical protein [Nocardia fluminea]|nr:hypothetical protein [Nocardia fluminea]